MKQSLKYHKILSLFKRNMENEISLKKISSFPKIFI